MVSDLTKSYLHAGREPDLYFWRDARGHEVDVVLEQGSELVAVEIKSGETVTGDFFSGLRFFRDLAGGAPTALVYAGDRTFEQHETRVYSWRVL